MTTSTDAIIVGAGPYGLATSAHLTRAGFGHRVFGDTMSFWRDHMPAGMLLRSPWGASTISDPDGALSLDVYSAQQSEPLPRPVPLERFVEYGKWFQRTGAPHVEDQRVTSVRRAAGGFTVHLGSDEELRTGAVVIATGLDRFARMPAQLAGLPRELVRHSSEISDFSSYAGRSVLVVGAGQSGLESAALLLEAGADVTVLVREPSVRWLNRSARLHRTRLTRQLFYSPTDVGPAGLSHLVATPSLLCRLPHRWRTAIDIRCIRPAGAEWLRPRVVRAAVETGRKLVEARPDGAGVRVQLDDGRSSLFDAVVSATGYRVDITRSPVLDPETLAGVQRAGGYPQLSRTFESSVPGLFFVGASAAWSHGPITRFIAGTPYCAGPLAGRLTSRASA